MRMSSVTFCALLATASSSSRQTATAFTVPSAVRSASRRASSSTTASKITISTPEIIKSRRRSFHSVGRRPPPPPPAAAAAFLSTTTFTSTLSGLFSAALEEIDPGAVDGTDLRVMKYPHPSLRAENAEITSSDLESGEIGKIAKEMFLVMYAAEGVGLAAPQVGISKRLMVYNESGDRKKWLDEVVMINPRIVEFSAGKGVEDEGCLSFPKMNGPVERSKWIKVEAQNLKGKKIKKKFKGWEARIFQHVSFPLSSLPCPACQ